MTSPLVSIVLPVYNGSKFLDAAVRSCREQTYQNWELILVDDASTDDTFERMAGYVKADSRIRSFRHPTNRKLPAALNTGFRAARGEYLTWTSDDNLYRPEALAEMVAFLKDHAEAGVVYALCTVINDDDVKIGMHPVSPPEALARGNRIGACFLMRRAVWEKVGEYAEDLFLAEDYDYWLRASVATRLVKLDRDLYLYRNHPHSLSNQRQRAVDLATLTALERNLPNLHWFKRKDFALAYLHKAVLVRQYRSVTRGLGLLARSLACAPGVALQKQNRWLFTRALLGERGAELMLRAWQRTKRLRGGSAQAGNGHGVF